MTDPEEDTLSALRNEYLMKLKASEIFATTMRKQPSQEPSSDKNAQRQKAVAKAFTFDYNGDKYLNFYLESLNSGKKTL
jgi:hypothetical protein